MNLFTHQPSFDNPSSEHDLHMLPNYGTNKNMRREGHRAQVTMIYEGKVFMFSDLSSEKAEQILLSAEHEETSPKLCTQLNQRIPPSTPHNNPNQWHRSVIDPNFLENITQGGSFDVSMDNMTCGRGPYHNSGNHLAAVSQPPAENKWWLGLAHQPPQ